MRRYLYGRLVKNNSLLRKSVRCCMRRCPFVKNTLGGAGFVALDTSMYGPASEGALLSKQEFSDFWE
jgi:hypothetical protein